MAAGSLSPINKSLKQTVGVFTLGFVYSSTDIHVPVFRCCTDT